MKKLVVLMLIASMIAASLCGCSASKKTETEAPTEETPTEGMANPWIDITEEDAKAEVPRSFKAPDGATNISWQSLTEKDSSEKDPKLIQLQFTLDGTDYCAREKYGAPEDEDISGMNYTWAGSADGKFSNWGDGNCTYKSSSYVGDENDANDMDAMLVEWYDIEIGIKYSLSATGEDLNGLDIAAIADMMYSSENGK